MQKNKLTLDNCILKQEMLLTGLFSLISLGLLVFLLVAIHDVQTAQGVGLYLSMKAGADSRKMYDLLVDAVAIFGALLLVVVPCMEPRERACGKSYALAARVLRFFVTFLAFMPALGLDYLVHLLTGNVEMGLRPLLLEGKIWTAFLEGVEFSVSLLQMIVPMFILLLAMLCLKTGDEVSDGAGKGVVKRWYMVILVVGAVAELGIFLIPGLAELLGFVLVYLLLLIMFDMWERAMVYYSGLDKWSWILFAGLGLRGIYLLLELMSAYKL